MWDAFSLLKLLADIYQNIISTASLLQFLKTYDLFNAIKLIIKYLYSDRVFIKKATGEILRVYEKYNICRETYGIKDMECTECTYINRQRINSAEQQNTSYYAYAPTWNFNKNCMETVWHAILENKLFTSTEMFVVIYLYWNRK